MTETKVSNNETAVKPNLMIKCSKYNFYCLSYYPQYGSGSFRLIYMVNLCNKDFFVWRAEAELARAAGGKLNLPIYEAELIMV